MCATTSSHASHDPWGCLRGLLLTLILMIPGALFGQGYFGTVSGEITDPSGAVVPGVKVTLVDQQKGYQFATTSDRVGRYLFTSASARNVFRIRGNARV